MRIPKFLLVLLLASSSAFASVSYDTSATVTAGPTDAFVDVPITIAVQSNRLLLVGCGSNLTITLSSVTGGGATWSSVGGPSTGNGTMRGSIWKGINPSTGAQTIRGNFSGAVSSANCTVVSFYGVDQTTGVNGYVPTTSGNNSITTTSGDMTESFDFDINDERTLTNCGTPAGTLDTHGFDFLGHASAHCSTATPNVYTWSSFDASASIAMGANVIQASAGGTPTKNLTTTGAGN